MTNHWFASYYTNEYEQEYMKIYVNDVLVSDGLFDEYKLKLVENIFRVISKSIAVEEKE